MLKLGVIGFSQGNGHPFSFSAIVNGYDDQAFGRVGWDGIHAYLRARAPQDFGIKDVTVSACWMPDAMMARGLAAACRIETVCETPDAMVGQVDAVLILRDDAASHWPLAAPFLNAGRPVFIDKPLCVDRADLDRFEPYLRDGRLMSCSGLRYAREADPWRAEPDQFGRLTLLRAAVVRDWSRYGVHMLECALGALPLRPVAIQRLAASHDSLSLRLADGTRFHIDAVGDAAGGFVLEAFGAAAHDRITISDNFTAFRRTLEAFVRQVREGRPVIDPDETLLIIRSLIAGLEARPGGPEAIIG